MSNHKSTFLFILFITLYSSSLSFFENNTQVILLNSTNFEKEVLDSKELWLIIFYAPWCGHCKAFSPEFEKAAKALKGIFKLGAVNADSEKDLSKEYEIESYPTVKFFGLHKDSPIEYEGERTAEDVIDYMFEKAKKIANARIGKKKEKKKETKIEDGEVVILDDDNFEDVVLKREELWMVAFYAPWCGHCKKLLPEWDKAAYDLKSNKKIKFGKLDATVNKKSAQGISGVPTIKAYVGKSGNKKEVVYSGERESSWLEKFAEDLLNNDKSSEL